MLRRLVTALALILSTAVLAPTPGIAEPAGPSEEVGALDVPADRYLPLIFVHGFMGSGQQFESQALRFTSNGHPAELIEMFEHDSLAWPGSQDQVWAGLDALIDRVLTESGADAVNLIGHSQGTGVVQGYLGSDDARADRVAAYVNLDGGSGGAVPDSVRSLAIWGEGDPNRTLPGADNITFADQAHTEVVNSPETFTAIHEFLFDEAPTVTEVIGEDDAVTVSGRVVLFPANRGAEGSWMQVWEVDPESGRPTGAPVAELTIPADGAFGPLTLRPGVRHEFLIDHGADGQHHVHLRPFHRSTRWTRILTSEPDGLANSFWEPSETSQNLSILRNKEWWSDQGAESDVLEINGQNILGDDVSPRINRTIGIFVHDAGSDGISGSVPDPAPTGLPFLTGVDLVIPAADPAPGTTSVRAIPRRGAGEESVCLPNLSSAKHRMSVQFDSFHRILDEDGAERIRPAEPTCVDVGVVPDRGAGDADPAIPVPGRPSYTG